MPQPPPELQGKKFGIQFVGPFALALRSAQAQAFQEWATFVANMEAVFPGSKDNVDEDDAIIRMGQTLGVNTEDMATADERAAKRQRRMQDMQQQKMAVAAQVGSEAYAKGTKAPEQGSPSEALMGAMG